MIEAGKTVEAAYELVNASSEGKLPKAMRYDPGTPQCRRSQPESVRRPLC